MHGIPKGIPERTKVGAFDGRCGRQERCLVMLVTAAFLLRAWWALRIVVDISVDRTSIKWSYICNTSKWSYLQIRPLQGSFVGDISINFYVLWMIERMDHVDQGSMYHQRLNANKRRIYGKLGNIDKDIVYGFIQWFNRQIIIYYHLSLVVRPPISFITEQHYQLMSCWAFGKAVRSPFGRICEPQVV